MAKAKLKDEKSSIISILVISLAILGASLVFFIISARKEELGGILLTSMLLFISVYSTFVMISRLKKYARVEKLQKAILDDKMCSVDVLCETFGCSERKLLKDIEFMMNNGYLGNYKLYDGVLVDIEAEEAEYARNKRDEMIRYNENAKRAKKEEAKPKSRKIVSEKCPNCGASVDFEEGRLECPYCGNSLNKV